jgi:hypothetical protein
MTSPPLALLALSLVEPLAAQASSHLAAWSESAGPALFNGVQVQRVDPGCPSASLACRSLLGSPLFYAGGTAYDPRDHTVWISTGSIIQAVGLDTCLVRCQFTPQLMNSAAAVSGLAVLDGGRRLLQLETLPGYLGLRSYDATTCPPTPLRDGCTRTLANGAVAGGLDVDPRLGIVFYSISTPTAIDWQTELVVARDTDRCGEICRMLLPRCGPFYPRSGVVTGLAYDACDRRLFATNGRHTLGLAVSDVFRCELRQISCCPTGSTWDYKGLAFVPGIDARGVGAGCAPRACAPCAPRTTFAGAPVIGNRDFGLGLADAEIGASAVMVLGGGGCTNGTQPPFLCGPLHPRLVPPPYVSPPLPISGSGSSCSGTARLDTPIPLNGALCGATLCAQWVVACSASISQLGTSAALQLVIDG